ncbi:Ger(x)C family spore germination C-terminal domain-containing protein [Pseudobacteroides cellulosolvens]
MLSESDKQTDEKYNETIALEGTAVFKKDKMVGSLTPEESRGIAWILNQTQNTVSFIHCFVPMVFFLEWK